jgi:hypothetical protein
MSAFTAYIPQRGCRITTLTLADAPADVVAALAPYAPCVWVIAESAKVRWLLHFEAALAFDWRSGELAEWLDSVLGIQRRALPDTSPETPVRVEGIPTSRTTYRINCYGQESNPSEDRASEADATTTEVTTGGDDTTTGGNEPPTSGADTPASGNEPPTSGADTPVNGGKPPTSGSARRPRIKSKRASQGGR